MQEEAQTGKEKEEQRWKQTLTFNVLYWSKGRQEGGRAMEGGRGE